MEGRRHGEQLKRGLKNHHTRLIALGGAIRTGLFLGDASIIQSARPEIIPGHAIAGFIAFLIMRQLGEMVVEEPAVNSFNHLAYKCWGSFVGLASGQNYWVLYVLVAMAGLTVVGRYIRFQYPEVPTQVSAAASFVVINAINPTNVKVFGEMELWFAIIKVIAVATMIIFGAWLLFSGNGSPQTSVSNLWDQGGFLSRDLTGLVMMMAIIIFSSGGLELVGIIAAEADNPEQSIPKVTNQVIYRILTFYISSSAILLSLMPQTHVTTDTSPFVLIFHELGDIFVASALNTVVLAVTLSVYGNCIYCSSHMLSGLAQQGNAPKALVSVDKRGVSANTILVSVLVTVLCVPINYLAPEFVFGLLMALVVSALVINWAMISLVHMKFRRAKQEQGMVTRFPALLYPLGDWICLLFMVAVLVIMLMTPGMAIPICLTPVWLIVLGVGYLLRGKIVKAIKAC